MKVKTLVRLAACCAAASMAMMAGPALPQAKSYAELEALPDWSGVWGPDWSGLFAGRGGSGPPAGPRLVPAMQKQLDDFNAKKKEGMNLQTQNANCRPPGMPGIMRMPYPIEFLFTRDRITIISETDTQVRRIFTDGRALPDDPDPAFNGWSVGHWDDGALVVDTIGLNNGNSLSEGIHATDQTHVHEVFKMVKPGVIEVTTTLSDPAIYAEPYTTKLNYVRHDDWEMQEYICKENNRDGADPFGRPTMDLSMPQD